MSEKHLTEMPWKMITVKHKVKDNGLLKSLILYGKLDATKEAAKVTECLAEILDLAGKLKKANEANEDVFAYLGEVIKEATKTKQSVASLPKPKTPEPETKPEEDDEGPDIKPRLINALKRLKEPEAKPVEFVACAAKPFYGVLLAKSASDKVGQAHKKILTELTKATKFIVGTCVFEKESHTFIVDPVPSGLAGGLKKALKEYTELTYKVRVRDSKGEVVTDGDTEVDEDEKPEETEAKTTAKETQQQTQSQTQSSDTQLLDEFTERFNTLKADILKATATKTQLGNSIRESAGIAVQQAKERQWVKANKTLDDVVLMKTRLFAAPQRPQQQPQPQQAAKKNGDTPQTPKDVKLSTYLTGRGYLKTARDSSEKALKQLQAAILKRAEDEPFYAEVEKKSHRLFDYLTPIDDSVMNKLEEASKCTDPELQVVLHEKVRELIQKQLKGIQDHPLASFVQKNPFGIFPIREPLEITLTALDKQLA